MKRGPILAGGVLLLALSILGSRQLVDYLGHEPLPVLDTLGGDFVLPSTLGQDLALADLRGNPVLLNFGFTACPDVCPTALSRMRAVQASPELKVANVKLVFVTLDPERDPVPRLKEYLDYFGGNLVGLTGSQEQIDIAAASYKVYHQREEMADGDYSISHSSHIYLIDGKGTTRATFSINATVPYMVETINRLSREG